MRRTTLLAGCFVALFAAGSIQATEPMGVYAIIDGVVLEPNESAPERAQLWGTFSIAKRAAYGYEEPAAGYLYFTLKGGKEDVIRREWRDLQKTAGSSKCVAFGNRRELVGRVRKPDEEPKEPDVYTVSLGVVEMDKTQYTPVRKLREAEGLLSPRGADVAAGTVTLVHREAACAGHPAAKFRFEIAGPGSKKEESSPLEARERAVKWSPAMKVEPGAKYTWRVWAVDGEWKGPVLAASFQGK